MSVMVFMNTAAVTSIPVRLPSEGLGSEIFRVSTCVFPQQQKVSHKCSRRTCIRMNQASLNGRGISGARHFKDTFQGVVHFNRTLVCLRPQSGSFGNLFACNTTRDLLGLESTNLTHLDLAILLRAKPLKINQTARGSPVLSPPRVFPQVFDKLQSWGLTTPFQNIDLFIKPAGLFVCLF